MNGFFVISIDLEKMYGVFDSKTIPNYGANIIGVKEVVPKILKLFEKYNISATWAFVGMMLYDSKEELLRFSPKKRINYLDSKRSIYNFLKPIGQSDFELFFCGSDIIELISNYPNQELASHTFSHCYVLEPGFDVKMFKKEMDFSRNFFKNKFGREFKTIIFPRNQFSDDILTTLKDLEIRTFRGSIESWLHKPRSNAETSIVVKIIRYIDTYINVFSNSEAKINFDRKNDIVNIQASLFLRPYNRRMKLFEKLKIWRIKRAMLKSAQNGKLFHIWWHPHNFGVNQNENLKQLEDIICYYLILKEKYSFDNITMAELGEKFR